MPFEPPQVTPVGTVRVRSQCECKGLWPAVLPALITGFALAFARAGVDLAAPETPANLFLAEALYCVSTPTLAIGYAAGNFFAGRYSVRLGMNRMVLIGSIVNVAGMGLLCLVTWAGVHSAYVFFGFTVAVGLGNGLTLPNANAGMLSIKPELAVIVTAMAALQLDLAGDDGAVVRRDLDAVCGFAER